MTENLITEPNISSAEVESSAARVLLARTGLWAANLAHLAARFQLPEISKLCAEVEHDRRRDSFRVAVVGEVNRGKSTVVNRLLGADVMPTGPVALTSGLVLARDSRSPRLDIESPDGHLVSLPLQPESWTEADGSDRVTVCTDTSWLRNSDIQIVDTAGSNTIADDHLEAVQQAIRRADAVIVCVSAEQGLTATERQFIIREVLMRRVPHVLVALTMADRLDGTALDRVAERTRGFLGDLGGVEMVVGPGTDSAAAAQLRSELVQFAGRPGRALSRARALGTILLDTAGLCEAAAETGRKSRQENMAEQVEHLESLRQAASAAGAGWAKLLAEFDGKGRDLAGSIRDQITRDRDDLIKSYLSEMRTVDDPQLWWEEVLPGRAREDLKKHAMRYTATLRAQVERDTEWLERQSATRLAYGPPVIPSKTQSPGLSADFAHPAEALTDTAGLRKFARLAGNTGAITGAAIGVLSGVSGVILFSTSGALAGNLAGERLLRSVNEHNVGQGRPLLTAALHSSFAQFSRSTSELVPALYAEIGGSVRDAARRTSDVRLRAAQAETEARWQAAPDWDELAAAASGVATDIHRALRTS